MQVKNYIIILSFIIAVSLTAIKYFLFAMAPLVFFISYNFLALLIGVSFIYLGYKFIKLKTENKLFNYFYLLIGVVMITVHITKIVVGNCN